MTSFETDTTRRRDHARCSRFHFTVLAKTQPAPCQLVKTGLPVVLQPLLYRLKEGGSGKGECIVSGNQVGDNLLRVLTETQTTEQAFSFPHTKDRIHFLASRGSYRALK